MCVSNAIPREQIRETLPTLDLSRANKWIEGWKVLELYKSGKRKLLKSGHADEYWTPGMVRARNPGQVNFTGGKMAEGEYGFHILRSKPSCGSNDLTVARIFFDADSVVEVGRDSAGNGEVSETVVAKSIWFKKKDYQEALKGGSRSSKRKVKSIAKKVKKVKNLDRFTDSAVKMLKKGVGRLDFYKVARVYFSISREEARRLYAKAKVRIKVGK